MNTPRCRVQRRSRRRALRYGRRWRWTLATPTGTESWASSIIGSRHRPRQRRFRSLDRRNTAELSRLLWYGNALIDAGRIDAGVAQLDRALAVPDSAAVITDHEIARWQSGDQAGASQRLDAVARCFPENSAAPGFAGLPPEAGRRDGLSCRRRTLDGADRRPPPACPQCCAVATSRPIATPFWYGGSPTAAIAASRLGERLRLIALLGNPTTRDETGVRCAFRPRPSAAGKATPVVAPLLANAFGVPAERLWG